MNILLVEDQRRQAVAIILVLRTCGIEHVTHATSARQAHEALRSAVVFEVMISDWHLGADTAQSVIEHFRRSCPQARCVVYSGDDQARDDALACGAHDFLVKGAHTGRQLAGLFAG